MQQLYFYTFYCSVLKKKGRKNENELHKFNILGPNLNNVSVSEGSIVITKQVKIRPNNTDT